jgi:hypothetical protein
MENHQIFHGKTHYFNGKTHFLLMGKLIISMVITIFSPWEVALWTPWHYLGDLVSTDVSRVASLDASAFCVAAAEERHGKDGVFPWKNHRKTTEKLWKNHGFLF